MIKLQKIMKTKNGHTSRSAQLHKQTHKILEKKKLITLNPQQFL